MDGFESVTDLEYAAIEPTYDRIRLAYQPRESEAQDTNVYIIGFLDDDNDDDEEDDGSYSIPYSMAGFGILYNSRMKEMKLNETEMAWIKLIADLAVELSRKVEPA